MPDRTTRATRGRDTRDIRPLLGADRIDGILAAPAVQILQHFARSKRAGTAVQPGAWMRAGSAQIEVANGRLVAGRPEERARQQQLIERDLAVKDLAAGQRVLAFE